jgi:hypothetical protein
MFIKPRELSDIMRACGMATAEVVGIAPEAGSYKMLRLLRKRRKGLISQVEMARQIRLSKSKDISVSYMGYATRRH